MYGSMVSERCSLEPFGSWYGSNTKVFGFLGHDLGVSNICYGSVDV